MVVGAGIGLLAISFLLIAGKANPDWGRFWMIRPLIMVPVAGALAGLCNYFIVQLLNRVGVNKMVAMILGLIVFLFLFWIGSIFLGLSGTLWD